MRSVGNFRCCEVKSLTNAAAKALYFATTEMLVDRRWPTMRFFALQGLGVIIEQIFKRVTGRRVSGTLGRLWLFAMTAYPGGALCRAWLGRGLLTYIPSPDTWVGRSTLIRRMHEFTMMRLFVLLRYRNGGDGCHI